jgi:hypothetical protein
MEVISARGSLTTLTQITIENLDLTIVPAQQLSAVSQRVLPFCAFAV